MFKQHFAPVPLWPTHTPRVSARRRLGRLNERSPAKLEPEGPAAGRAGGYTVMWHPKTDGAPRRIHFLLFNKFSMLAFTSSVEPLRSANRLSGRDLYVWEVITPNGNVAEASNGIQIKPDSAIRDPRQCPMPSFCAAASIPQTSTIPRCRTGCAARPGAVPCWVGSARARWRWRAPDCWTAIAAPSIGRTWKASWKPFPTWRSPPPCSNWTATASPVPAGPPRST